MSATVMKQALKVLELLRSSPDIGIWCGGANQAIDALRIAVEAAERQKPAMWQWHRNGSRWVVRDNPPNDYWLGLGVTAEPLYTAAYPLPDDLYDSKDWQGGSYAERVEWLHTMYESKKRELEAYLNNKEQP